MERFLEKELIDWKNGDHIPLLLRGARQVGKSYLVELFGKKHFDNIVKIDFELNNIFKDCFQTKEPIEILKRIEVIVNQKIVPGKSLLFLDEIQECPEALISLRYFKEKMPSLHVIAAGSLMEFLLNSNDFSFPVGRVDFLYLRPFSFKEFLKYKSPLLFEKISSYTLSSIITDVEHNIFLKLLREYLFTGGMPAAVDKYLETNSFFEAQKIHIRILKSYESDFGKYADHVQHKYLQIIFQKAPSLISQIIKYVNIDSDLRSRELKPALDLISHAGLINQIFATTASGLPLHAHIRYNRFKLLFLDVGLLQTANIVDAEDFFNKEILQINSGVIAEQFVGQELIFYDDPSQNKSLLFWENEKTLSEIDYIKTIDSKIIPIEVKSGSTGSLKSLHNFIKLKKTPFGIRISQNPLSFYDNILSIPLYLLSEMNRFTIEAFQKAKK